MHFSVRCCRQPQRHSGDLRRYSASAAPSRRELEAAMPCRCKKPGSRRRSADAGDGELAKRHYPAPRTATAAAGGRERHDRCLEKQHSTLFHPRNLILSRGILSKNSANMSSDSATGSQERPPLMVDSSCTARPSDEGPEQTQIALPTRRADRRRRFLPRAARGRSFARHEFAAFHQRPRETRPLLCDLRELRRS